LENIKNGFTEKDPQNKDYYEENYKFYADKLDKLDEEFKSTIESLPKKDIVVAHKAYSYMCKEYGLNQIAIDGLSPDSEPDSLRMAQIIDVCKLKNIKVIFTEELVSPKIAENIAQSTGAKVLVLNPLEGLSQEEIEKGEDYFSVMHKNLESLKEALS
jgi:zinc transport system substrate-binding protein